MDKRVIVIVISVLLVFGLIVSITGLMGKYLGKNAELAALSVLAVVLFVILLIDRNKKE